MEFGCSIQGPAGKAVRDALAPLKRALRQKGRLPAAAEARAMLRAVEDSPRYRKLTQGTVAGRRRLRSDVLFPLPSQSPPRFLHLYRGNQGIDFSVARSEWPLLRDFFSALSNGLEPVQRKAWSRLPLPRAICGALDEAGWWERWSPPLNVPRDGFLFVGHNSFLWSAGRTRILVDPYFRPASPFDLPNYQPMQLRDLPKPDAVLITHSHGDHFHPPSLLGLPRDVPFFVPFVERESLFSTDMAQRLRQLGFSNVQTLAWWQEVTLGDAHLTALPFYGEQPTGQRTLYPGLRNIGNTYAVRSSRTSAVFLADSGADALGDMAAVLRRVRKQQGPFEWLFSGVRGFRLEPIQYGLSTLELFLADVRPSQLLKKQAVMADADDVATYAKLLGAKCVVPCADGGAPWYWREGMGPKYPGFPGEPHPGARESAEHPDADPWPERVVERLRELGASPLLLRPGQVVPGAPMRPPFQWGFEQV